MSIWISIKSYWINYIKVYISSLECFVFQFIFCFLEWLSSRIFQSFMPISPPLVSTFPIFKFGFERVILKILRNWADLIYFYSWKSWSIAWPFISFVLIIFLSLIFHLADYLLSVIFGASAHFLHFFINFCWSMRNSFLFLFFLCFLLFGKLLRFGDLLSFFLRLLKLLRWRLFFLCLFYFFLLYLNSF